MTIIGQEAIPPNTKEVFRRFVGKTLTGLMFDDSPTSPAASCVYLIFDDGEALTMDGGRYWVTGVGVVNEKAAVKQAEYAKAKDEVDEIVLMSAPRQP